MADTILNEEETKTAARLALGRLFRVLSRPYREGDDDEYFRCRSIILDASEGRPIDHYAHNWARDRNKGAQGQ